MLTHPSLQIVFEEFGFSSFYQAPAPVFSLNKASQLYPQVAANTVRKGLCWRVYVCVDVGGCVSCAFSVATARTYLAHTRIWHARVQAGCGVVVDAGFSFTHVVPIFDGRLLLSAAKRINVGGKALTNYLKELVSYRCACVCVCVCV